MIVLIALAFITHQHLIYQFDANSQNKDDWQQYQNYNFYNCGGTSYLGTANNYFYVSRIFLNLEPHSHIQIEAELILPDQNRNIYLYLDYENVTEIQVDGQQLPNCGQYLYFISILSQHNRRTVWIEFETYNKAGLVKTKVSIIKCEYGCKLCIESYPKTCQQWKLHQYSFNQKLITNSDGWTGVFNLLKYFDCGNCEFPDFQVINYSTELPLHKDVLIRFYKWNTNLIILDYIYGKKFISSGYQLIEILIINYPSSRFNLIMMGAQRVQIRDFELFYNFENTSCLEQINDQCFVCHEGWIQDESLLNRYQSCSQCYTNIEIRSDSRIQIRNFEDFHSLNNIRFENWIQGCVRQIHSQCLICQDGWILDEFMKNCNSYCGDYLIQGQEQCDDGNSISHDGCFNCNYSCCEFCINCQFGICLECQEGFIINQDQKCDPLCGDGIVIPYTLEQCDIETEESEYGCKNCKFISMKNCEKNLFQYCFECDGGYQIQDNVCIPYCGDDEIVIEKYEDCDDGNLQHYDGCYECKFQCIEGCHICDKGNCTLKCGDGYEFFTNSCHPICGDQIITIEEECDDGNKIQYDGCFQCKYSYPQNCVDCYQGICYECDILYQLLGSNRCEQKKQCGDGFLQENEQCDDGNNYASDGCDNCLIQQNWLCSTITIDFPSLCTFIKAPNFIINYINMTQNKQYVSISFDQQVKIETQKPLSETIVLELLNISQENWNSSLYIQQDVGSFLSFGEYILEIEVFQLLQIKPILRIELIQSVSISKLKLQKINNNVDNVDLVDSVKLITLKYPLYLNKQQKIYSQNLYDLNKYMIYCLSGMTGVSLLFGSGDLFVEILAILQFQQYLRYINVQFPLNLEVYFTINDMITIQPFLNFIQYPEILQLFNIQEGQKYSNGKFREQNTNLLINLSSQILQCLIFLFLIILLKWIKKAIYNTIFTSKYFYYMSWLTFHFTLNRGIMFKISQFFYRACINLIKLEQFMSFSGVQKALLLNGWDMIFKILIYTKNIETFNYLDVIQIFMLTVVLILYLTIILNLFKNELNFKYSKLKSKKIQRFEILNFTRQLLFLLFLIYIQKSQIMQLGFLLITSIFQIEILLNYHNVLKKSAFYVQLVVELSVLLFILSSFIYIEEFQEVFYEEKKILLGSQGLIFQLIIIFYQSFAKLRQKFGKKKRFVNHPKLQVLDAVEN